jgi:hypothetical protein
LSTFFAKGFFARTIRVKFFFPTEKTVAIAEQTEQREGELFKREGTYEYQAA